MNKKAYIAPKMEVSLLGLDCEILNVSTNLDDNEPGWGGESGENGNPEPGANNRDDWGSLW